MRNAIFSGERKGIDNLRFDRPIYKWYTKIHKYFRVS